MDNASDYGSELLGSTLGWLTLCFFCVSVSPQQTAGKIAFQIKNQITFIVTSPQHKCLGEWNSYERAPDSAEKQQTIYIWTDSAKKKQQTIYIWTDSAKKLHWSIYSAPDSAKKTTAIYIWTDSAKKQQTIYIWTDSAKKLQQFTYGQTVQKTNKKKQQKYQQFTYGQYIFTDCTEDNVQNTHTYTQYA